MRFLKTFVAAASVAPVIGLLVGAACGQGFFLNNTPSTNYAAVYSPSVTSNGLIFTGTVANQFGTLNPGYENEPPGSQLEYVNFNALLLGGPTAASANQLMALFLTAGSGGSLSDYASAHGYVLASGNPTYSTVQDSNYGYGINPDAGVLGDNNPHGSELKIPGVAASPGYIDLYLWEGNYGSFDQAALAGAAVGTTGVVAQAVAFGIDPRVPWLSMPDVFLTPTLSGDASLDGKVDINDLSRVLTNYDQTGMTWSTGDFNGDGKVDINDLSVVLTNYDKTAGTPAAGVSAVPEPRAIALLAAAMTGLVAACARRKRR